MSNMHWPALFNEFNYAARAPVKQVIGFFFCVWKLLNRSDSEPNRMNYHLWLQRPLLLSKVTFCCCKGKWKQVSLEPVEVFDQQAVQREDLGTVAKQSVPQVFWRANLGDQTCQKTGGKKGTTTTTTNTGKPQVCLKHLRFHIMRSIRGMKLGSREKKSCW